MGLKEELRRIWRDLLKEDTVFEPKTRIDLGTCRTEIMDRECDPRGVDPHQPGAKLDAGKNRLGLVLGDFAPALIEVGIVGTFGANKYTPHGWKSVPDGEERYTDAMVRHLTAEWIGEDIDRDSQMLHAAQVAWNALARLTLILERRANAVAINAEESCPST